MLRTAVGRYISPRLRARFKAAGRDARLFLDASGLTAAHIKFHDVSSDPIDESNWTRRLFEAFYAAADANLFLPADGISCAESWVSFRKQRTKLLIYNFFEKNYGIRDPMLFRFSVFGAGGNVVWTEQIFLTGSEVKLIDPFAGAPSSAIPEEGTLLVQAFHPRAKTKGGQLRYFVFYGADAKSNDFNCGLHSLALPEQRLLKPLQLGYRNVACMGSVIGASLTNPRFSIQEKGGGHSEAGLAEAVASAPVESQVLFFHEDGEKIPLGVWHDGQTPHFVKAAASARKIAPAVTGFFVPDFEMHSPVISVVPSQIGFEAKSMTICCMDGTGAEVAKKSVSLEKGNGFFDLGEIFRSLNLRGPLGFVCSFDRDLGDFESPPTSYVHVYYKTAGRVGDQVHSHSSFGARNSPFSEAKSYRCLKFAPFVKSETLDFFYSVHNVGGAKANSDQEIFVRVITDTGVERRTRVAVPYGRITFISHRELMKGLENEIRESAIVQYEHATTNFNGSWHFMNRKAGTLGTDHFTGG